MSSRINAVEKGENWKEFFGEVVDETLKQIFRADGAKVIYDFLENHSNLRLDDVAENPEVFSASLEKLMLSAAKVIEQMILKNLYARIELTFEEKEGYKFSDYIRELREE